MVNMPLRLFPRATLHHAVRGLWLVVLGGLAIPVSAAVRLPRLFSDQMVIQRDRPAPVWGWADPGEQVTVRFGGQQAACTANDEGAWMVRLKPLPASSQPRDLIVSGADTLVVRNVVVGDVWLCSGDFGVFWETFGCVNAAKEIATANRPLIRLLKVESKSSNTPLTDIQGAWKVCSPETVADFSALAYFFGRTLHQEIRVPIGLIDASYRYSSIQSWISPEGFRMIPELKLPRDKMDSWNSTTPAGREAYLATIDKVEQWLPAAEQAFQEHKPIPPQPVPPAPIPANDSNYRSLGELSNLYYGMIAPLMPFAFRGVVWSMGENGGGLEWAKYHFYLRGLVDGWRAGWGQGDFPVYFELLPQVGNPDGQPGAGGYWAGFRARQMEGLSIPNTGMAVTFDVSDYLADTRNRQDAGQRLALWALAREYHRAIECSGPLYHSHRVEADRVIISFDHVGRGLMAGEKDGLAPVRPAKSGVLKGFAVAGADKKWYRADARIVGKTIVARSDKVPTPVAVRYAYADNPAGCNLYNHEGLPTAPFRTDDW